ncbi:MAG: outer membrane protein assembly factor BamD [Nitrosomonadales bacterium]|nr:outer membrane protein assembly factor BamD [Nitrosomonadales bacterium]
MVKRLEGGVVLHTLIRIISLRLIFLAGSLLLGAAVKPACAEMIDRIQINQAGDEAEIQIRFVTRVQFVRQVMLKNGDIRIYLYFLGIDATDPRLVWQRRDSPPSNIVSHFNVTYPESDSSLSISFGKEVDYYIRPGNDGRSISIFTPIAKPLSQLQVVAAPAALPSSEIGLIEMPRPAAPRSAAEIELTELEAKQLFVNAQIAFKNNLNQEVIDTLKKLLGLPANQQSQAAQLMIAQAYEKNGEFVKARTEYDLYLKRYPKGKKLNRVRESLARVFMAAYQAEKSAPEKMAANDKMIVFGSFSQHYYKGVLHTNSMVLPAAEVTSLTSNDQSQLISSLEFTGLKRTETAETRLVFRNAYTANLLPGIGSNNSLSAAYVEQASSDQGYFYGVGRQAGAAGGVPSRFDGAWLSRNLNSTWRINGSFGEPAQASGNAAETRTFAAISVDLTRLPEQWSGNAYLIGQRVSGTMDRRAAGIEAHYFNAHSNHMALLEYDTLFKKVNVGLLQDNWTTAEGSNYTMLIDHRRLPSLQTSSALLLGQPTQSIAELLSAGVSTGTLHADALAASRLSNQFMIGMTRPYSTRLKLGGDIRISNTTSYEGYDSVSNTRMVFPRKVESIYSIQVAGNSLLFDNDLGVASISYTNANTYKAKSLSFSQTATFRQNWQLDIALQHYTENNNLSEHITRISPGLKLSYRMKGTLNFESGAGFVQTHTRSPTIDNRTRRKYFNLGYRMDF